MKYVMVIGDGMADFPIESLGNMTPMEYLAPNGFRMLGSGELLRLKSCPETLPPGSDVAFLTLLGNDTEKCYNGRSPLEAAGMGVAVNEGEVAFRLNLCSITDDGYPDGTMLSHNGGGVDGEDAMMSMRALMADAEFMRIAREMGLRITPTDTFRHVAVMPGDMRDFAMTPPHDIVGKRVSQYMPTGAGAEPVMRLMERSFEVLNGHEVNVGRRAECKLAANTAWLWGAGSAYVLDNFEQRFGVRGTVISAVPLVKGIASLNGLKVPNVEGATGLLNTNYDGKLAAAIDALRGGDDFALIHLEAPDEMSHDGSLQNKLEAIRRLNDRIVEPLTWALARMGDYRVMLMPDHYTLLSTRTHDGTPVPVAIFDSKRDSGERVFSERACSDGTLYSSGAELLSHFFSD